MNLNDLGKSKDQEVIDNILAIVAKQFKGEDCKIWLSGISRADADKAASSLRADRGNEGWSFSVEAHGDSSYLVISRCRLAKSGEYGDH